MREIKLTQNKFALVDDSDFEWLNQWEWYALKDSNMFYAYRHVTINKKQTIVAMHREILRLEHKDGKQIDHIDRNGLNNQRFNLRLCDYRQNQANQILRKNSSSKFKGVYWNKVCRKWQAQIGYNGKTIYLGLFTDKIEAGKVYDKKAIELFGRFANINFKAMEVK